MASEELSRKPLKRLAFIQRYADYIAAYGVAGHNTYKGLRAKTPAFAEPYVSKAEDTVNAYAAPTAAYVADTADKLLHYADDKVDYSVDSAYSLYKKGESTVVSTLNKVYAVHSANVDTAKAAAQKYFELVSGTGQWVADKLSPQKNVQYAKEVLDASIAKAKELSDPDTAVQLVIDAWNTFAAVPAVAKLLASAEPLTTRGLSAFYTFHDTVVANALYKKVFDSTLGVFEFAETTTPYKLSATYVYPVVKPVADPAVEKLSKSKVVTETLSYWKPKAAASA